MPYAKSSETRRKLLDATASLMRVRGYDGTGLSDIASLSGVPKGSLYHLFPGGKEELATETLTVTGDGVAARLNKLIDKAGSPAAGIAAFCNHYIQQLQDTDFRAGCPLATVALESAGNVPRVHAASGRAFEILTRVLTDRVRAAGAAPAEAEATAVVTIAAVEGALLLAKAQSSTKPLEIVRDRLVAQLGDIA